MSESEQRLASRIQIMFTTKLVITGAAVLMAAVGAAMLWKQATAKSCPAHNRCAGIVATIIGWGQLVVSAGLVVFTWAFSQGPATAETGVPLALGTEPAC
jgi:hypothetical protein